MKQKTKQRRVKHPQHPDSGVQVKLLGRIKCSPSCKEVFDRQLQATQKSRSWLLADIVEEWARKLDKPKG